MADFFTPPAPDEIYDWMLKLLDLPPRTFITRGFFRCHAFWEWKHRWFNEPLQREGNYPRFFAREKVIETAQRFPISALGLFALDGLNAESRAGLQSQCLRPNKLGGAFAAELLLRRDLEILGRAQVAQWGLAPYLEILARDETLSHHEQLEIMMRWREDGFFAGRDEAFRARFPAILASHQQFLRGEGGEKAVLCGCDLREVSWEKGALRGADLRGAIARNLDLSGDDFSHCDWRGADLMAANLSGCNLQKADLRDANLDLTLFSGADLTGARKNRPWKFNDLTDWNGDGPKFNLHPGVHQSLDFSFLDLHERNFSRFDGERNGPDFSGSDLRGAIFDGACFHRADFSGAKLQNARFQAVNLDNARFQNADLHGANVCGANLQRADFAGADVSELVNAERAQWDENPPRDRDFRGVCWPRAQLYHRNFAGCDFLGADLSGCNLRGANFSDAILQNADLRGAELENCDFRGADLRGARVSGAKLRLAKR